ncbi:helix-turn-helix transcriptional regulator [Acaryochloris sp. 'Moss Beach']|uniref:helix-turn-helix domain-containing protein n=1 Tax=Acaryochloris sp. 'Moss Beach' TaxID=2740837 RepID=UPI001F2551B5|nr:AraC family transcriptional regulator [Acaryochloris sp. 'Moss Beach']UJB67997.1 helix-turn-helix transcriptional regulator [Acaryochloris sp. 'Moss Beach']
MNSQSPQLLEAVPQEWIVSQQIIKAGGLTISHHVEPPSDLVISALSQHVLNVTLSHDNTQQFTQIGKQKYSGPQPSGSFWLAVANDMPCRWRWESVDETMVFDIDPLYLQTFAMENGYHAPERLELKSISFSHDPQLEMLAQQYHREIQQGGLGGRLYSEALGNLFLLHILRNYCYQRPKFRQYDKGLGDKRLKRVLAYIEQHLAENIGLQKLATVAGLSQCHFSEMFKKSLGVPPYRYVLLQRLERAKRYLRQSDRPIIDVALICGFADQSHLTKHFRKSVGMTPRAFRES